MAAELDAARAAVGSGVDVAAFMKDAAADASRRGVTENGAMQLRPEPSRRAACAKLIGKRASSLRASSCR